MFFTLKRPFKEDNAPVNITINGSNGTTTTIDLSKLIYADNDSDAATKGVAVKGYYLASLGNTMGVKHGTLVRREL